MSDQGPPSPSRDESEQSLSRWPRWSSDLHESLASQEASASELRQELDDLRRTLDAPPAGEPGRRPVAPAGEPGRHRRPSRRRVLTASAAAVVVLGVIGVGLATRGTDPRTAPAAAAASSASATSSPSSTPGAVPGTSLPAVAPLPPWPGQTGPEPQGLPAHGLGVDLPGTEVTAALGADRRTVEVYERALLAPAGATLTLSPARSPEVARSLGAAMPTVENLHATIDGRPVPATATASGWTVPLPSTDGVTHLALRYRLKGAVVRTEPAPRGRYSVVLTPLTPAGDGAGAAVVVRIRDPRVAEVYCPGTTNQLCGREDGATHVATVPAGSVPVVVGLVTFPS